MLVSVIACCVLAWWSSQTRLMLRQQRAVVKIRELGGHASYARVIVKRRVLEFQAAASCMIPSLNDFPSMSGMIAV